MTDHGRDRQADRPEQRRSREVALLMGRVEGLQARVHALQARVRELQSHIAEIHASTSWRLTAPMRWIVQLLRGGIFRRRPAQDQVQQESPGEAVAGQKVFPEGFPASLLATEPPRDINDSHRVLGLQAAMVGLYLPDLIEAGCLRPGRRYHGRAEPWLRIAVVACEELADELAFDAEVTVLAKGEWNQAIAPGSHDFILIETSWNLAGGWGIPFVRDGDSGRELADLVSRARELGIPVVLWARTGARDLEGLAWLAGSVDRCYAVDGPGHEWLKGRFGGKKTGLLPPAVQPAIHNPVRTRLMDAARRELRGQVLLDGWWEVARGLLDDRLDGDECNLWIVESNNDYSFARLQDSGIYAPRCLGVVTPAEKSALLRCFGAELFLARSFKQDWKVATMMLRAAACGCSVVSLDGGDPFTGFGLDDLCLSFPQEKRQPALAGHPDVAAELEAMMFRHRLSRAVLGAHTLGHRLERIAKDLGLSVARDDPRVAHILVTKRPGLIERNLERFRSDTYPNRELVVVVHSGDADMRAIRGLVGPDESIRVLEVDPRRSLGDCINYAIEHTTAGIWMKIDDDDYYGAAYTSDMVMYQKALHADLMGKPPMFLYLERDDQLLWDPAWAEMSNLQHAAGEPGEAMVAGGTLAGTRKVIEEVRFSSGRRGGSDTDFIRRAKESGYDLVAADGFNFARYRGKDPDGHTWRVDDDTLRAGTVHIGSSATIGTSVFI